MLWKDIYMPSTAQILKPGFVGVSVQTRDNLKDILKSRRTGTWVANIGKIRKCKRLMVISMIDKGSYFIADIKSAEMGSRGKNKIIQEGVIICFKTPTEILGETNLNLKFSQAPLRYFE